MGYSIDKVGCTMMGTIDKVEGTGREPTGVEHLIGTTSKEDGDEEILQPQVGKGGRIFVK